MTPTPLETNIFKVVRSFLLYILPAGVEVIKAQVNRVAEPASLDYVMMTPLRRQRLETNVDSYADVLFTASIAGTVMTVTGINFGTIQVGSTVFGTGLATGATVVLRQLSGSVGGAGTYSVSLAQSAISQFLAAGLSNYMQATEVTVQLDVHGPNSADNAQVISTLFRDDFAVQQFATSGFDITPFYADDPKQLPFINDQQQYEDRWVVEACMQANIMIPIAQQFASALSIVLVEVDGGGPTPIPPPPIDALEFLPFIPGLG